MRPAMERRTIRNRFHHGHLISLNWFDVSDKVNEVNCNTYKEDDTSRIDKKGLLRRTKSKSTQITMLEMRKKTSTLLCSYKQNHPLMSNDDIAIRSRNTSADSNNDTTGLWFTNTFDNINNYNVDDNDDEMVNVPPSSFFPPSPLGISPFDQTIRAANDSNKASNQDITKKHIEPTAIRSHPMTFQSHCVSLDDYHFPQPQSHHNLEGTSNQFPSQLSSARNGSTSTSSNCTAVLSLESPQSISKSGTMSSPQQPPPMSDRITSTIAQLCQSNKNAKFQKRSLVQVRKDQLATNLAKNRMTNRSSKGLMAERFNWKLSTTFYSG